MKVGFVNICSLRRKVLEIQRLIAMRGVHIMCLAETWLSDNIADGELHIPHFRLFRKDRGHGRGGGVAIYCHESIRAVRRHDLEIQSAEIIWLEVHQQKKINLVGCCYRAPAVPADHWTGLEESLHRASAVSESITLLGDFNVDLLQATGSHYNHIAALMSQFNLTNYVTSPTRVTSSTSTLLDLYLSTDSPESPCEILPLDMSDHYGIMAYMHSGVQKQKVLYRSRNFATVDWDKLDQELRDGLSVFQVCKDDLNESVIKWMSIVDSVLDSHAPMKNRNRRARPCPWLTSELQDLVRTRNKLHSRVVKDPTNVTLRTEHKAARRAARRLERHLRNEYFRAMCRTANPRLVWKAINSVTGRCRVKQTPGASLDDMSAAFGEVVHDPSRPALLHMPVGPGNKHTFSEFATVSPEEVLLLLRGVDPQKATGSDNVPGILLHKCAATLSPSLCQLFNASLASGTVPALYKLSVISPLYKSGDASQASNYRPLSLLPIVSRLLEKVVHQQLTAYLTEHNLLPETQFAYRAGHSTEDALVLAVNRWRQAKHDRLTTGIALIDMSKAFDRVLHNRLIAELFSLGIHDGVLNWFSNYLTNRFQQVKCGNKVSRPVHCSRGVPQGSVLGPILFTLYTRRLGDAVPVDMKHQEFADDILLDSSNKDPDVVCRMLSEGVSKVAAWLTEIGLLLNSLKTKVLFICPRGSNMPTQKVYCGPQELSAVLSVKYLGLHIDHDLSWNSHVSALERNISRLVGAMWRNGKALTLRARKAWLVALIRSQLTYASNAFVPSISAAHLDRLTKLFKRCVRAVFRVYPPVSSQPLLQCLHLQPLSVLFQHKVATFVFRCLNGLASSLFSPMFRLVSQSRSSTGTGTRGSGSNLLVVPFVPGPAGRGLLSFYGSIVWNNLPATVRCQPDRLLFRSALSDL